LLVREFVSIPIVIVSQTTHKQFSNLGFDRNDMSTVHKDKLPLITEKGMCLQYAVTHEDFAWAIRGELIVSFDAINFTLPYVSFLLSTMVLVDR
jgi:hypothetical protein